MKIMPYKALLCKHLLQHEGCRTSRDPRVVLACQAIKQNDAAIFALVWVPQNPRFKSGMPKIEYHFLLK